MAILDRFRKTDAAGTKKPAAKKKATKKAEVSETKLNAAAPSSGNALSSSLLRLPHVSEKAARLADKGTYVFRVAINAEKVAIRKAVEALYNVNVESVRTISMQGKPTLRGRRPSKRSDFKKALVTLKKGQKLDLYEGV